METKIRYWENILKRLEEKELPEAMQRVGESGIGDWHENAEYEDAERQIQVLLARMAEVKKIIQQLKKARQ